MWVALLVGGIVVVVTAIRWFEQTAEAVDNRWWHKLLLLVLVPPSVWLFPSRVAAGRPSAVPRHAPIMGRGLPKGVPAPDPDGPPPGTPPEFLGLPKVPPRRAAQKPAVDPEKLAKLKQKMREQGMLPDEDGPRDA